MARRHPSPRNFCRKAGAGGEGGSSKTNVGERVAGKKKPSTNELHFYPLWGGKNIGTPHFEKKACRKRYREKKKKVRQATSSK